jgi:tetratricopeptide (TPR) repeat protein
MVFESRQPRITTIAGGCVLVLALLAAAPALGAGPVSCEERFDALAGTYDDAVALPKGSREYIIALFGLEDDIFAALERCPDDPDLLALQGETQIALGRYELAVLYGERVVDLAPDSWRANSLLGGALASKGAYDEGAEYLARAVAEAPDNLTLKLNLCNVYRLAGRTSEAIPLCDEVAEKGDERLRALAARVRAELP